MLDKLPLFVWKILLPSIYAIHREQVLYIHNPNEHNYNGIHMSNTITAITALRQTCKYMRDVVLSPKMCKCVLTGYQLNPNSNLIVAIPRPPRFIKMHWDKHIDHRKVTKGFTPLYWIRAMAFDIKRLTINEIMLAINNCNTTWDYRDREFGWTIHLTNTIHEINKLVIDQDVELIGLPNTQLEIVQSITSSHRYLSSMVLRNLDILGTGYINDTAYVRYEYDHVILDHCTFKGLRRHDMLEIKCKKFAVTNCKFNECRRAIKFKMHSNIDGNFSDVIQEKSKQGTLGLICNNRFDSCVIAMNLAIEYCLVDQDGMSKAVRIFGNVTTNPAKYVV